MRTSPGLIWLISIEVITPPCHGGERGALPRWVASRFGNGCVHRNKKIHFYGFIAQLVERLAVNQVVVGSSPTVPSP